MSRCEPGQGAVFLHKSDNQNGQGWGRPRPHFLYHSMFAPLWGRRRPHPCLSWERRRPAGEFPSRRVCNPKGIVPSSPGLRGTSYPGLASVPCPTPTGLCHRRTAKTQTWALDGAGVGTSSSPFALPSYVCGLVGTQTSPPPIRGSLSIRSARWTRAGTAQRAIPTARLIAILDGV